MARKAVVKMLSDKNLVRVEVLTEEEVDMKVQIIDRANQLRAIEHVNVVVGSEQKEEENLEAFDYNVELHNNIIKRLATPAENVNPSPLKRNKVSPKESFINDNFAKTDTNYEHND